MKRVVLAALGCAVLVIGGYSRDIATKQVKSHKAHWGYKGEGKPSKWGALSSEYKECGIGLNQSPIDLTNALSTNLPPLVLNYQGESKDIIDNGHTIEVEMASGNSLKMDGKEFELKQFHFHSPSENHIDGKSYPLEAHFVNVDKDGEIAVVALMFQEGAKNSVLENIWQKMPSKEGEKNSLELKNIANALLPNDKSYYRFNGSLTTPPCSEGVRWYVLKTPVTASKEQIAKFHNVMGVDNNRPIQPINARIIAK